MTPAELDALEKPRRRTREQMAAIRVGSPKDDDGRSERTIQRGIIKGLRQLGFRCVHVPNGGSMSGTPEQRARQGVARRLDGVVTGFPDLILLRPGTGEVTFLEIKRPGGLLSEAQQACIAHLVSDGFRVGTASSLDDALALLRKWKWI